MKIILTIFAFILSSYIFAQDTLSGVIGIPFGSSKEYVKKSFKKKYPNSSIYSYSNDEAYLRFKNVTFGGKMCISFSFQFVNNKMHTVKIIFANKQHEVFDVYDEIVSMVDKKYNVSDRQNIEEFYFPYDDISDKKSSAAINSIREGKSVFKTIWTFDDKNTILVQIMDRTPLVEITYQNHTLMYEEVNKTDSINLKDF
jgi:hypothetical protein